MERPKTLQQAIQYFSDEQTCIDTLAALLWPDGVQCPYCFAKEPYWIKTQKRWKCRQCRKQFSVKRHTIFEDSAIPLQKWLPALWLLTNCKNGISSYELARDLGVTQKTGWFMLHRLRLGMQAPNLGTKLGGPDGGAVEVDETFVGGKAKNMHKARRTRINQIRTAMACGENVDRYPGKATVQGMFDRELREVRATVLPNVKRETLQNEVLKNVKYGSAVYTDSAVGYDRLNWHYVHEMVNHAEKYVDGQVHTNSLENFWSLLKRTLSGTYVAVEPFHLDRYIDEQVFRFNNRRKPMDDYARFEKALSQVAHKRLTFAELTGKDGSATSF